MRHARHGGVTAVLVALSLAACSLPGDPSPSEVPSDTSPSTSASTSPSPSASPSPRPTPSPEPVVARTREPQVGLSLLPGGSDVELALAASNAFWASAPLVVLAPAASKKALAAAKEAGVPLLLTGKEMAEADLERVHAELARLATELVVLLEPEIPLPSGVEAFDGEEPPARARPADLLEGAGALVDGSSRSKAAAHNARAAGATVFAAPKGDPRAARSLLEAYGSGEGPRTVTALGDSFGDGALLGARMRSVSTGVTLPNGSQLVFDDSRYVALYGSPLTPALGVLGEQSVKKSVSRARKVAKPYRKLVDEEVVPMFEIIVTVASASAGKDGNYSNELDVDQVWPYVKAAKKEGIYVLLDLQPGRTDFLTQAKQYEELLREPHVGLALDPEWRLKKNQVHLRQIGSVGIKEVNRVADWLAGLVAENELPQKMFVLHQFTSSMIRNREKLDMSHPELAMVLHVDGQGSQGAKHGTWSHLRKKAPKGLHWGWKNFYDEDVPMATPKQTVKVDPTPDLITYQ